MGKLSRQILVEDFNVLRNNKVTYGWGVKAPAELLKYWKGSLDSIKSIDCSGYFRLAIWRSSQGTLDPGNGSWRQKNWLEKQGYRKLDKYSNVGIKIVAADQSRVFACYVPELVVKGVVIKAAHIWLVRGGKTFESHGGKGIDSRPWWMLANLLPGRTISAYELPSTH